LCYDTGVYPVDWQAEPGVPFLDFFQHDSITKQPKGIVAIDLTGLP